MRIFLWALSWILLGLLPLYSTAQEDTLTNISNAFSAFSDNPSNQNRRELLDALAIYNGPPSVTTVNAHLTVMMHDAPSNKFKLIAESADAARRHLEPISETLPKQYLDARFIAAIAGFNGYDEADAIYEMAHIQGVTRAMSLDEEVWEAWAKTLHYRAYAWAEAILGSRAISRGSKAKVETRVNEILSTYPDPSAEADALTSTGLDWCDGEIRFRRKPRYPIQALQKGKVGVVVLGLDLDEGGKAANAEVLAAVPEGIFEKDSLKWVESAYYKPANKSEVGKSCRLERTNIVQTLAFSLG